MTPREQVADLYLQYPQSRTFAEDVALYKMTGYVWDTPELFLMARPVKRDAPEDAIRAAFVRFDRSIANAWFIFAFAGNFRGFIDIAPFQLPWAGWSRRMAPIRWYEMKRVLSWIDRVTTINQKHTCQTQKE